MQLTVNGEVIMVAVITLADFLTERGILGQRIAVELNRQIVPKSNFHTTFLSDGDVLEIVQAIGGG
jgi:sulfur carrier protein